MKPIKSIFLAFSFSFLFLSFSLLAKSLEGSKHHPSTPPSKDKSRLSTTVKEDSAPALVDESKDEDKQKMIQDLVQNAADYINEHGKNAAFAEFNKKKGNFTKENLYIFSSDFNGIVLVDPFVPEKIGSNQINMRGPKGEYVIRDLIAQAKKGPGWIIYKWVNPKTQQTECKKSYLMPFENNFFIGAGYYYKPYSNGSCSP